MSYPIEIISDESFVYRQTTPRQRSGTKKRKFPNESHFELRHGESGLSVNWDKYITIEENFILIAITKSSKGNYLDHSIFRIFKYPVSLFRSIDLIEDVIHKPEFHGNPHPKGKPNNQSHSEVIYENDIEIFVKLCSYCDEEYENAYCDFDLNSINDKVSELKLYLDENHPE
ncbi:hypothetical protein H0I25_00020 [Cellulophaga sp. HaHa_2_95]|uniref:hypothetical protein n=1 Tax=Cellulophaga sp. HaHa_2_95 TaxID=2745558 RepID=UPI001C4E2E87|nr:hypothetical protein [Cellulophaga sp. HaHa_2_95]QXP56214.1 hypothetical protein H0I25_00020 [Cellulophaga sp. HaHa_2_95]